MVDGIAVHDPLGESDSVGYSKGSTSAALKAGAGW